jgi:hypothetical protein
MWVRTKNLPLIQVIHRYSRDQPSRSKTLITGKFWSEVLPQPFQQYRTIRPLPAHEGLRDGPQKEGSGGGAFDIWPSAFGLDQALPAA